MRKLRSSLIEGTIDVSDGGYVSLVIQDKQLLYNVCSYCYNDFKGKGDYFEIYDTAAEEKLPICFIPNIFDLGFNTKKNINALYRVLKNTNKERISEDIKDLQAFLDKIAGDLSLDFSVELEFDGEIKAEDIFKMMDLRFKETDLPLQQRLIKFIRISYELTGIQFFVFYNLQSFIDIDCLEAIVNDLAYSHITIIDILSEEPAAKMGFESRFIIDKDFCLL